MVFSWFKKRRDEQAATKKASGGRAGKSANASKDNTKPQSKPSTRDQSSAPDIGGPPAHVVQQPTDPVAAAANLVLQHGDKTAALAALSNVNDAQVVAFIASKRAELREAALALPQMQTESGLANARTIQP